MNRTFTVYILTNWSNMMLYVGVTNNMHRRLLEHRDKRNPNSFTARYNINKLVYVETSRYVLNAIAREKQIKKWSRKKKANLIESTNPNWDDLAAEWF